jgi:hypothetical protein
MIDSKFHIGFIIGAVCTTGAAYLLSKYDPFGLPFPFGKCSKCESSKTTGISFSKKLLKRAFN